MIAKGGREMKIHTKNLALAAGITGGLGFSATTIAALMGFPGFMPFATLLKEGYGFYGYSISWAGALVGFVWGFVEGFMWIGILGLIYNKLSTKK